jgi:hypothetical protein
VLRRSVEIYILNSLHCIVHWTFAIYFCMLCRLIVIPEAEKSYSEDGTNANVGRILNDSVQGLKEYRIPPHHFHGKSADFTSSQILTDSKCGLSAWWLAPYPRAPPPFLSASLTCCFQRASLGGGWGELAPMLTWCCPINGVKHAGVDEQGPPI